MPVFLSPSLFSWGVMSGPSVGVGEAEVAHVGYSSNVSEEDNPRLQCEIQQKECIFGVMTNRVV